MLLYKSLSDKLAPENLQDQLAETGSIAWMSFSANRLEQLKKHLGIASVASVCIGMLGALVLVEGKFSLLSRSAQIVPGLMGPVVPLFLGTAIGMGLFAAGTLVAMSMNRLSGHSENLNSYLGQESEAQVKWGAPSSVAFLQSLMTTRLVINVALACLSASPHLFLASAALEVLGTGLISRWKWVVYTCIVELKDKIQNGPQKLILIVDPIV